MITFNGLPLYRVTLATQDDGVVRVSLVDDPAVQSNFDVFRAAQASAPALYAVQDEDRHLVRGVVLRADFPIFRRDTPDDPGYYVTFSRETIRQIAERYLADGRQNNVDTDHDGEDVEGVQMVQYFLKDTAAGIDPEGFETISDGSLFAEYHVTNPDVWDEIKAGTFKGFSVEIFYTLVPAGGQLRAVQDPADEIAGTLSKLFSKIKNMSILSKIRAGLQRVLVEFGAVTTDKGVIYWDGGDDLKAGDSVYSEDEDGTRQALADGDYVTSDNKTIVVVDGKVSEIEDPEAEVAPEAGAEDGESAAAESAEQMARQRAARFDESYDEKQLKILEAIRAARGNKEDDYGYLASAGDDFGVFAHYGEDTEWRDEFTRYSIAWDESGNATASDPVECRQAFVPMDFDDSAAFRAAAPAAEPAAEDAPSEEEFAAAVRAASTLKAENEALKARVASLEKRPAASGAHQTYKAKGGKPAAASTLPESTGDKGLDRLARRYRK